jgi:DNA helicase II / ATP-dependent DNA helicase PcrA
MSVLLPPIEQLWQEVGFQPNENQEKAIRHTEGPLFLPAGPGSGKTRVLLWRVINLIVYCPQHIFLGTFTEKAALNLKEGLLTLLGMVTNKTNITYDTSKMYIGTIHALCNRLINDRRFGSKSPVQVVPIDELEQYFHVANRKNWNALLTAGELDTLAPEEQHQYINNYLDPLDRSGKSRYSAITLLTGFFNRLSEESIKPERLLRQDDLPEPLKRLTKMYQAYLSSLKDQLRHKYDFSLIQQKGLEVLGQAPAESAFKYVIIDEYQDTNTIQEKLFFKLAQQTENLCVVGDDDQALYRFRGATVENFVEFPARCQKYFENTRPRELPLNTNYRSRKQIVELYTAYIAQTDWRKNANSQYRVHTKQIQAHSTDTQPSVLTTAPNSEATTAFAGVAQFIRQLLNEGKLEDPNQVAFLFSSLKSTHVDTAKAALEAVGLRYYAPRSQPFLQLDEARHMLGLLLLIFEKPERNPDFDIGDFKKYQDWMDEVYRDAQRLCREDKGLNQFVAKYRGEIEVKTKDYQLLLKASEAAGLSLEDVYDFHTMPRQLESKGVSEGTFKSLSGSYLQRQLEKQRRDNKPAFTLKDVITRATSLDWNVSDLFYKLLGFPLFRQWLDPAEKGNFIDEGPVYNLGLLSQYLGRFQEIYKTILRAEDLLSGRFKQAFFNKFLFAIYRRGETEFENAEDPFPRGRVAFLTIHQSKGLEFPVVVLGNTITRARGVPRLEEILSPYLNREGEPLERMEEFDNVRKFYVALSRAEKLLVIPQYKRGVGAAFKEILSQQNVPLISSFNINTLPEAKLADKSPVKSYSYTSDYLLYERCPRQYMVFRKYGFEPSRLQTMFFGSLVHKTIEDIHNFIIQRQRELNRYQS